MGQGPQILTENMDHGITLFDSNFFLFKIFQEHTDPPGVKAINFDKHPDYLNWNVGSKFS